MTGHLYRVGVQGIPGGNRRFIFGETWHTPTPPTTDAATRAQLLVISTRYLFPFGTIFGGDTPNDFSHCLRLMEQLFPQPKRFNTAAFPPPFTTDPLNSHAPEGSVILQRVGAAAGLGRMMIPIQLDDVYTDRPRRRRLDLTRLSAGLAIGLGAAPMVITTGGRTFTNVILHREADTLEPVDHYRIRSSPGRRWRRWKNYDRVRWSGTDFTWVPPEGRGLA